MISYDFKTSHVLKLDCNLYRKSGMQNTAIVDMLEGLDNFTAIIAPI